MSDNPPSLLIGTAGRPMDAHVMRKQTSDETIQRDAERWRKLMRIFAMAYDAGAFESPLIDIYCRMQESHGRVRTMQAELRWDDKLGEPVDLGLAIDAIKEKVKV